MDRIELAERRYAQIVPEPSGDRAGFPVRKVRVWLTDDVAPVVESYCRRPAFRDLATWPLRALVGGAGTAERRMVEDVDAGLVACARLLLALARKRAVWRRLEALNPPRQLVTCEEVEVTGTGTRRISAEREAVDLLAVETGQVEHIADHFWVDLTCPNDYFVPTGRWMTRSRPGPRADEFVVSQNPELHAVGDFVTRCLMRRVDVLYDLLDRFRGKCLSALPRPCPAYAGLPARERAAWRELAGHVRALRGACLAGPDVATRDSCVVLTQTLAAFGRAPDVAWLGLPPEVVEHGAMVLRHRLTHMRDPELAERVAAALGDLRRLYQGGPRSRRPSRRRSPTGASCSSTGGARPTGMASALT